MKEKALRSIGAFANISEGSLESLEAITKLRYIEKNGILHYEGEYIESAYFLARGKVEVYEMDKNDNELFLCYVDSHLSDGRLINAFGTFAPYEANASVRGVEPSEIVLLDLQQLHQLVTKNIEISNAILSEVMNRMITFKNFINFNEIYDSTSRVAYILGTSLKYFNQVQRQTIAHELNFKLETLSRILQKMMTQGLIAKDEHGDVYIKDKQAFEALYGGIKSCDVS